MTWCPKCGRRLSNVTVGGKGSCPRHGMVWGEPYAPKLVINEEARELEIMGIYMHMDEEAVVYRDEDGKIRSAPDDCVSVIRANEWEGEW